MEYFLLSFWYPGWVEKFGGRPISICLAIVALAVVGLPLLWVYKRYSKTTTFKGVVTRKAFEIPVRGYFCEAQDSLRARGLACSRFVVFFAHIKGLSAGKVLVSEEDYDAISINGTIYIKYDEKGGIKSYKI